MIEELINTATAIVFNKEGKILSVSRKYDHNDMGLVGGKANFGEDTIDTLKRECLEETGIELTNIKLLHKEAFFDGFLEHTYTADAVNEEINYDPIKEPALAEWVDPQVIMDGSFGKYNEKVLGLLGIKRK